MRIDGNPGFHAEITHFLIQSAGGGHMLHTERSGYLVLHPSIAEGTRRGQLSSGHQVVWQIPFSRIYNRKTKRNIRNKNTIHDIAVYPVGNTFINHKYLLTGSQNQLIVLTERRDDSSGSFLEKTTANISRIISPGMFLVSCIWL